MENDTVVDDLFTLFKYGHKLIQKWRGEVYSFYGLALLCLVRLGCDHQDQLASDTVMKAHFTEARILFQEFVNTEKRWLEAFLNSEGSGKQMPVPVMDSEDARNELVCKTCKCCLVNLHFFRANDMWCYDCWKGLDSKQKKKSVKARFRFMAVNNLELLLEKQTNILSKQ
jgi:hypothetical protein